MEPHYWPREAVERRTQDKPGERRDFLQRTRRKKKRT